MIDVFSVFSARLTRRSRRLAGASLQFGVSTLGDSGSIMSDTYCKKQYKSCMGGVALRVIVCVVSLILAGTAIVVTLRSFENKKAEDYREAKRISEYGLLAAIDMLHQERDWSEGFSNEPYEGGSYDVELERQTRDGAVFLKIKSTGTMGSVTQTTELTLMLEMTETDSVWVPEGMR